MNPGLQPTRVPLFWGRHEVSSNSSTWALFSKTVTIGIHSINTHNWASYIWCQGSSNTQLQSKFSPTEKYYAHKQNISKTTRSSKKALSFTIGGGREVLIEIAIALSLLCGCNGCFIKQALCWGIYCLLSSSSPPCETAAKDTVGGFLLSPGTSCKQFNL